MNTKLRIPPQNIDAEKALLGSVIIKSESIFDVLESVNDNSFYSDKHKIIFKSMMDLVSLIDLIVFLIVSEIFL
jgi:replicative DNA helicase